MELAIAVAAADEAGPSAGAAGTTVGAGVVDAVAAGLWSKPMRSSSTAASDGGRLPAGAKSSGKDLGVSTVFVIPDIDMMASSVTHPAIEPV
jgi:hypothetical protein